MCLMNPISMAQERNLCVFCNQWMAAVCTNMLLSNQFTEKHFLERWDSRRLDKNFPYKIDKFWHYKYNICIIREGSNEVDHGLPISQDV